MQTSEHMLALGVFGPCQPDSCLCRLQRESHEISAIGSHWDPTGVDQLAHAGPGSILSLPDSRLCRLPKVSRFLKGQFLEISAVGFQPVQTSEHMLALGVFGLCQILAFVDYLR
jgi:hypothetical protein